MSQFPATFPSNCPANGRAVTATLFHGCEHAPPAGEDFVPFAYSQSAGRRKRAARIGCNGWGISCWITPEDAIHAQEAFEWAAGWHIYKGDVTASDGKLAHTPSSNQKGHHTFWCYDGVDLKSRFQYALPPIEFGE